MMMVVCKHFDVCNVFDSSRHFVFEWFCGLVVFEFVLLSGDELELDEGIEGSTVVVMDGLEP